MDCRVIGARSDAVLRTAMPGNDSGEVTTWIAGSYAREAAPFFERRCPAMTAERSRVSYSAVMPGLDPGIHHEPPSSTALRGGSAAWICRIIGARSDAVLRTAMPGNDSRGNGRGVYSSSSPPSSLRRSSETTFSSSAVLSTMTPCVDRPAMRMPDTGVRISLPPSVTNMT